MSPAARNDASGAHASLPLVVGAYASSTSLSSRDERALYQATMAAPRVAGLEFPFFPGRSANGLPELLRGTTSSRFSVMTLVGATVAAVAADPRYGLASTDHDGRARALADVRAALTEVDRSNELLSVTSINAIELHSAPRSWEGSSKAAFASSLDEISSWRWGDTQLLVEHCDAGKPPRPFSKGFLSLEDEVDAIESVFGRASSASGIVVNWGRSAIEGMSAQTPVDHLEFLRARGLLRGIVFSGVASEHTPGAAAWADVHLPVAHPDRTDRSLLDSFAIANAVRAAGELSALEFVGVKVSSGSTASFDERMRALLFSIATVAAAVGSRQSA